MDKRIEKAPKGKVTYILLSRKLRLKIDKTGPEMKLNIVDKKETILDTQFKSIMKTLITHPEWNK